MVKTIECELRRSETGWFTFHLFGIEFRKACPALCKGLRPGKSRLLILTQTKRGIKLEVKHDS